MKKLFAAALALLSCLPAYAQWQTPNHSVPVGRGPGVIGQGSAGPGATGLPLIGQGATTDPSFAPVPNAGIAAGAADTAKCSTNGTTTSDCALPNCQFMSYSTATHTFSCAVNVGTPQGYLTPCQVSSGSPAGGCAIGQPVQVSDVISASTLYYEPVSGNLIPIYNGTSMVMTPFSELTLAIPGSRLANTVYDVCVFSNSGVLTPVIGPAWTGSTPGGGTRGTGGLSAQIVLTQGIWTNAVSITAVNGGNTYTIPAFQCTIVGSILIDGVAGQVTAHRLYGQNRKFGYWNFYNQQPIVLKAGDSTLTWNYTGAAVRPSNNNAANSLTTFTGLPQGLVSDLAQAVQYNNAAVTTTIQIGVCFNSTTSFAGRIGQSILTNGVNNAITFATVLTASFDATVGQLLNPGQNTFTACEANPIGAGTGPQFDGTEQFMTLTTRYMG